MLVENKIVSNSLIRKTDKKTPLPIEFIIWQQFREKFKHLAKARSISYCIYYQHNANCRLSLRATAQSPNSHRLLLQLVFNLLLFSFLFINSRKS